MTGPSQKRNRTTSTIPYGWRLSDEAPRSLVAVPEQLDALNLAMAHLRRGASIRETAQWLSHKTGRRITDRGLASIARGQGVIE